jgi:hypothetical protein
LVGVWSGLIAIRDMTDDDALRDRLIALITAIGAGAEVHTPAARRAVVKVLDLAAVRLQRANQD